MSSVPWYHEGLRFECTACGDCCTGAPGFVWVNKQEIQTLAAALGYGLVEFEQFFVRSVGIRKSLVELTGGDCIFFDSESRKCRVYDFRPRQCRTWPFWHSNLLTPEAWKQTAAVCPGCDRGKLYTLEEIEARAGVIKV